MKKFITITNLAKDENLSMTEKISKYIQDRGGSVTNFYTEMTDKWISCDFSDIPADCECALVLGGDGTLIRTATRIEQLQIPLIGINLGTLGYLCELEEENVWSALDALMEDRYTIEHRMIIKGAKAGESNYTQALNDIVIHRIGDLSTIPLKVYVNGELLTTYLADGIIVATPTGSTAYNMSAGGPIVDPKSNMLLLTPINAHNLNSKSIVLEADDTIEIEVGQRRTQQDEMAGVSFDGDSLIKLGVGERVLISKSDSVTKICKINRMSFLEILRRKMNTTY